jgi:hypothetical protein
MTPTDTLPSQSDRPAMQAVDALRLLTSRRFLDNLPLQRVLIDYFQPRKVLLVFDTCDHLRF